MINLIPPAATRVMKREYWMRVAVVWSLLVSVALVFIAFLLVPSFVLVASQLTAYESQVVEAEAMASEQFELVETVREANQQAAHLNEISQIAPMEPYITLVDSLANANISITQFAVVRTELAVATITLNGVATTRESLAQFRDRLLAAPEFFAADLPLASLASNSNNIFTITLTVAPPQ